MEARAAQREIKKAPDFFANGIAMHPAVCLKLAVERLHPPPASDDPQNTDWLFRPCPRPFGVVRHS
jgi:hypothetical protein